MPIHSFTSARLPALLEFVEALCSWGSQGRELGLQTFKQTLRQPGLDSEENCFLAVEGGRVQGYCLVFPELPIGRVVLQLDVALPLSGGSLARDLVRSGVNRARELGVKVAHVCVAGPSTKDKLLQEERFHPVRAYWEMLWRHEELETVSVPPGFTVRAFQPGDAPVLTAIQNAAFEGSWGFCPNTAAQIEYRSSMANTSKKGILLLFHGDETAGYCWTCITPLEGNTRGVIGMIGVAPDYRGQGLSRTILLAGMEYLRSINVADIGLEVDGSNTPAIRLYNSVGFEKVGERQWFERVVS